MQQTLFVKPARVFLILVLLLGAGVRYFALRNELWFDEIVSIGVARALSHPWDVWGVRFDNNHLLNTLVLYFLPRGKIWLYRLFPYLCGVGLLFILIQSRRLLTVILAVFSYPLILYSSEARGYAPALLFAYVAYEAFPRAEKGERTALMLWYSSAILGFLSHGSFLFLYLGLLTLSLFEVGKNSATFSRHAALHAPILGFICVLWFEFYRYFPRGSGPRLEGLEVLINTASIAFGGPEFTPSNEAMMLVTFVAAMLTVFLGCLEMGFLFRHDRKRAWFFGVVVFIAPILVALAFRPKVLFPRYFLVSIGFFLILLGSLLERLAKRGRTGRAVAGLLTVVYLVGNIAQIGLLVEYGRGSYRFLAEEHFGSGTATFAADQVIREKTLLDFYREEFGLSSSIDFIGESPTPIDEAEYYLSTSQDLFYHPPTEISSASGYKYVLIRDTFSAPLSGWRVFIYKRKAI